MTWRTDDEEAAMFLSRVAARVRLLVRGSSLAASMSSYLSSRLEADPAITIDYGARVVALCGHETLEAVTILRDGQEETVDTCAVFVMVGAVPNTGWLADLVRLDDKGFVLTGADVGAASPYAASCPASSPWATCVPDRSSALLRRSAKGRSSSLGASSDAHVSATPAVGLPNPSRDYSPTTITAVGAGSKPEWPGMLPAPPGPGCQLLVGVVHRG